MKKRILFILACVSLGSLQAEAGQKWKDELRAGVRSGALTKAEAKELRAERKKFRELRKGARSDGKVSEEEKASLKKVREQLFAKAKTFMENGERRETDKAKE